MISAYSPITTPQTGLNSTSLNIFPPASQHLAKIWWQVCFKTNRLFTRRMYKPKALCVQCLAGHHLKAIMYKSPELWQALLFQDICSAVGSVTEKRMAYMFHMRPDLMGAAGFKQLGRAHVLTPFTEELPVCLLLP